jgi:hypothetical protein
VLHDLVGEALELFLRDAGSLNGGVDGHGFDIPWVDRDRPVRAATSANRQKMCG